MKIVKALLEAKARVDDTDERGDPWPKTAAAERAEARGPEWTRCFGLSSLFELVCCSFFLLLALEVAVFDP